MADFKPDAITRTGGSCALTKVADLTSQDIGTLRAEVKARYVLPEEIARANCDRLHSGAARPDLSVQEGP